MIVQQTLLITMPWNALLKNFVVSLYVGYQRSFKTNFCYQEVCELIWESKFLLRKVIAVV